MKKTQREKSVLKESNMATVNKEISCQEVEISNEWLQ